MTSSVNSIFCICVGGMGGIPISGENTGGAGGYNGGGKGGNGSLMDNANNIRKYIGGGGGGGATSITDTNRGVLANYKKYTSEVVIVAGGGGGGSGWTILEDYNPGHGGGTNGEDVTTYGGIVVKGGTQTSGYEFGKGQDAADKPAHASSGAEGNGGGGGGWYGGYAYNISGENSNSIGAGGSAYIGRVANGTTTAGIQTGNGKALITWMPLL